MDEQKSRIVVIDLNAETVRAITTTLMSRSSMDVKAESEDLMKGYDLIKNTNPQVVILNLHPDVEAALALATRITQNFSNTILMITSNRTDSDIVIRSMRAGAREFFPSPVKSDELLAAVQSAVIQKSQIAAAGKVAKGKIISVFGTKGGVGTTTVATNIATSLLQESKKDVLLMDLNLQFGHVALYLNIKTRYSIVEVAKNLAEIDLQLLKTTMPKHDSGLRVLTGPMRIEEAEIVTAGHVEKILHMMRTLFDYIIVDTSRELNEVTLKALDEADTIVMITDLDVASIFNANRLLDLFQRIGYGGDKLKLVINRHGVQGDTDPTVLEKLIEYPVFFRIPLQDYATITSSINRGIPITLLMPNLKISKNYSEIAQRLNGGLKKVETVTSGDRNVFFKKILTK
jgi:pilus assembly protein CpaE